MKVVANVAVCLAKSHVQTALRNLSVIRTSLKCSISRSNGEIERRYKVEWLSTHRRFSPLERLQLDSMTSAPIVMQKQKKSNPIGACLNVQTTERLLTESSQVIVSFTCLESRLPILLLEPHLPYLLTTSFNILTTLSLSSYNTQDIPLEALNNPPAATNRKVEIIVC